ncbi:putative negative regulator of RcsB-dependent stress response [Salirhabdus euzebyi]|uniref:Putative negative regulator of RcsB-dependent stress response n=1 Tax=Salirhabdus euzebyi TaxID=394506 RepID=A0A841Q2X2_9BACI|nr:hypothetical protein [Salirhabdus euzebyi]MBB6451798.1 putative negative regulator of RcsB-dependent stress response [Salirhabdus euzebyi]
MNNIVFYVTLFAQGLVLAMLDVEFVPAMIIILLVVGVLSYFRMFYPLYGTKDIEKTEKFLLMNKKNPFFHFVYAVANDQKDEVEHSFEKVMAKYKAPARQALHTIIYALYKKDAEQAREQLPHIQPAKYQSYYEALVLVEEGKMDEAQAVADNQLTGWMKETVRAEILLKAGDKDEAKGILEQAMLETKGLQCYLMYKNLHQHD